MMPTRWLLALSVLVGCGSDAAKPDASLSDAAPDAAPDAATFQEAAHDPAPQVRSAGGVVIAAPKIVPIFFAGEDSQAQLEQFLTTLAGSPYWTTLTADYGVGGLTILPSVIISDPPPTTDDALQVFLGTKADGATLPLPDANTIYTVFLPPGAALSTPFGDSCTAFGGYHDEITNGGAGQGLIYALLPRCTGGQFSALDGATSATSHEFFEAATDPHPFTAPAFNVVDDAHAVWGLAPGGELGDMCEYADSAYVNDLVGSFVVQRQWSNSSAAAGHDPCVPVLGTPYLGAAPRFTESLTLTNAQGVDVMTQGTSVPLSTSKTIEVDLFSDGPTADYTVQAIDGNVLFQQAPTLTFAFDRTTGHNGDKLNLTIQRTATNGGGGNVIVIATRNAAGATVGMWWGYVAE